MTSILSESTNSDQDQQIDPIINQAYSLLCQDKITQGIQIYKKCIEQHPRCWRVYQNLGVAYIMSKDYQNALTVLKTYVSHVPRDPFGHDSLGVSYSQLNDPLQAIASFVNSINLSPGYYMSYYNLGVVLAKLQLYEYALNVYRHCLTLYPNYINAMNNIADIYKKLGRIDEAIELFKEIIQIDPEYVLGIKNLGNCYFVQKDFFNALQAYVKTISIDQTNDSALHNLALCLDHYGLFHQAGTCVLRSYDSATERHSYQTIAKPFIAGNLFIKQLQRLNSLLRLLIRLGKSIDRILKNKFLQSYLAAMESYNIATQVLPNCPEIYHNIQSTRLNFISYLVKFDKLSQFVKSAPELEYDPQLKKVFHHLERQEKFMQRVIKWRKYTKHLVRKIAQKQTFEDKKYFDEQQKVHQLFNKKLFYPSETIRWKSSTYISRTHNHNISRLILKRTKFIRHYNQFNREITNKFGYRMLLTTLTDQSQANEECTISVGDE